MWKQLGVRWQLLVLITIVLTIVEIGTLSFTYGFDVKERKNLAQDQSKTLSRALEHDLVLAIINPQADIFSDISFRLSGFESLAALSVINESNVEVFRHARNGLTIPDDMLNTEINVPRFTNRFLYLRLPLIVESHQYGEIVQLVDLTSYNTGLREQLILLIILFPIELAIGLLLAWWISGNYARPFTDLASAMKLADIKTNQFPTVNTDSMNEIGVLYRGFNTMISQIRSATSELRYMSEHDSLTGLANRYAIEREIERCLQAESKETTHVIASLDLDSFKLVNDSAGHVGGDEFLRQLARLFSNSIPDGATVARVGGDDFFILFPNTTEADAIACCNRIMHDVSLFRFAWNHEVYSTSASCGVVTFRPHEYTNISLLTALDVAFYAAKAKGHNQIYVYRTDDAHVQQFNTDIAAVSAIREALDNGPSRFELFAQAIVPIQHSTQKFSYEILLRLRDGNGELIAPYAFLPTADRYQLMIDIDIHVLTTYLTTALSHRPHIDKLDFVNINLSGATLNHPEFQRTLLSAIDKLDFPWNKLVLEITETSAVGNLAKATDFIRFIREKGIRVALDDFGTGMASFEYLKNLPLDIVKIDGCFIRDMLTDPVDRAMVNYAHEISQLRGQKTIAEFVETEAHLKAIKDVGIDYAQGYHLGKPCPLTDWLK